MGSSQSTLIMFRENGMGSAEPELRLKLARTYLSLLLESEQYPAVICFYAEGVRLATEGSPVLDQLKELERRGTRVVLCSTCLNYFGLTEKVQVGIVGGMTDILEAQLRAEKVITL